MPFGAWKISTHLRGTLEHDSERRRNVTMAMVLGEHAEAKHRQTGTTGMPNAALYAFLRGNSTVNN